MSRILYIIIICTVVFSSCKKKDKTPEPETPVTPAPVDEFGSETAEYIKFKLKDSSYSFTPPQIGTWSSGTPPYILAGATPEPNRVDYNCYYYGNGTIVFSISKEDSTRQATGTSVTNDYVKESFKVGSYPFRSSYSDPIKRFGMTLSFKDGQGNTWRTQRTSGSAYQGNANLIIEKSASYTKNGFFHTKIKALVNCKVYNNGNDSTQITNGEVIISFFK